MTRRKVVSVDARNHGDSPHTPDMSYSLIAKDMTHLFKQLQMDKINFMGEQQCRVVDEDNSLVRSVFHRSQHGWPRGNDLGADAAAAHQQTDLRGRDPGEQPDQRGEVEDLGRGHQALEDHGARTQEGEGSLQDYFG